ncbi:hypothetical protein MRX96_024502 [Rhipicephalus microplus]
MKREYHKCPPLRGRDGADSLDKQPVVDTFSPTAYNFPAAMVAWRVRKQQRNVPFRLRGKTQSSVSRCGPGIQAPLDAAAFSRFVERNGPLNSAGGCEKSRSQRFASVRSGVADATLLWLRGDCGL